MPSGVLSTIVVMFAADGSAIEKFKTRGPVFRIPNGSRGARKTRSIGMAISVEGV